MNDPQLQKVISKLQQDPTFRPDFQLTKGRLFYHSTLVISSNSGCIPLLFKEFHSSPTDGHSSFLCTYRRMAGYPYWVGMRKSVMEFVQSSDVCQRQKYVVSSPMGLLHPFSILEKFWEEISVDFITGLPKLKGFEAIFVVVDRLSKTTPFEVVYGRKPPSVVRYLSGETKVEAVTAELVDRDEGLRQLKYHLNKVEEQMKRYADKKRTYSFEVGEWVFLKLRPHRQQTVTRRINQKLARRYIGPFPILKKIPAVSYKLKLPEGSRVHTLFHISQLKKAIGDYYAEPRLPDGLEMEAEEWEEPE
ncbi:uncharacterized protein [Cicer arietinum]|uniref:uncharacterized protein n=1 Tax=Cicer arietinum TaxID=3827 RepID=UPI003CC5DA81